MQVPPNIWNLERNKEPPRAWRKNSAANQNSLARGSTRNSSPLSRAKCRLGVAVNQSVSHGANGASAQEKKDMYRRLTRDTHDLRVEEGMRRGFRVKLLAGCSPQHLHVGSVHFAALSKFPKESSGASLLRNWPEQVSQGNGRSKSLKEPARESLPRSRSEQLSQGIGRSKSLKEMNGASLSRNRREQVY